MTPAQREVTSYFRSLLLPAALAALLLTAGAYQLGRAGGWASAHPVPGRAFTAEQQGLDKMREALARDQRHLGFLLFLAGGFLLLHLCWLNPKNAGRACALALGSDLVAFCADENRKRARVLSFVAWGLTLTPMVYLLLFWEFWGEVPPGREGLRPPWGGALGWRPTLWTFLVLLVLGQLLLRSRYRSAEEEAQRPGFGVARLVSIGLVRLLVVEVMTFGGPLIFLATRDGLTGIAYLAAAAALKVITAYDLGALRALRPAAPSPA